MAPDADNPTLLQVLVLERVDRTKNMARFYVLSIEPTLFEDLALVRPWGRIGSAGRERIDLHPSRDRAQEMARSQAAPRIPAPGLISGDRLQDADMFRGGGAPQARAEASIAVACPRCESLLWRQDFDWNSEWGPNKP